MKFYSTNDKTHLVSFKEAIFKSLPPDNGLYYPEYIPTLSSEFIKELTRKSKEEIGFEIASKFIGNEISKTPLQDIIDETLSFDFPLVQITEDIYSLELFQGPTWAFKDLGARFLSRCIKYFNRNEDIEVTILVATSGDTGGAVAAGFYGIEGVNIHILYPEGKVSELQRKQLTTWGGNIQALEVDGTFDDCQRMVKAAFLDKELNQKLNLSSANSINIARLIPQSFYYFFAFQQLTNWDDVVVSVPSGNYGNLTAGLFAKEMGLPISKFIAASNANTVVPDYLQTGFYNPRASVETYANAMDVGAPSNFARMLEFFDGKVENMRNLIDGFSLFDPYILTTISQCYQENQYVLDPHGAIGYQALKESLNKDEQGIFLETAHPVKFLDVIEKSGIGTANDYLDKLDYWMNKKSFLNSISNTNQEFKSYLLDT